MKRISALFLCVLMFVIFFTIVGNKTTSISRFENIDNWPAYYQDLAIQCKYRASYNCCMSSVHFMMDNSYSMTENNENDDSCPAGFQRNIMKCIDSFSWCEPSANCPKEDWNCMCSRIKTEENCSNATECVWSNYHSNEFSCMERFCMDYSKEECAKHSRCLWLYDKNGRYEYCEEAKYYDPERHVIINQTNAQI